MLMIRFQRIGRRNDAAFRIIVTEKARGPKAGKYVELVGTYNPKTKATSVDGDSIKKWISHGAQVSPSLNNLLIRQGVLTGKKINVLPKKRPIKSKEDETTEVKQDTSATEEQPSKVQTSKEKEEEKEEPKKEDTKEKESDKPSEPVQVEAK